MLTRLLALSIVLGFSVATLSAQSSPDEQLAKLAEKYGVSEKVMKAALRANSELGRSTVKAQAALHFFAKHGAEGVGAVCALIERGQGFHYKTWMLVRAAYRPGSEKPLLELARNPRFAASALECLGGADSPEVRSFLLARLQEEAGKDPSAANFHAAASALARELEELG